jgi:neuroligin
MAQFHLICHLSSFLSLHRSPAGIELADFPTRELLFGVTSIESYLDFSAQDLEFGFNETRRDRILRTYVRNVYQYHLNEIFSALKVSIDDD